MRPRASTETVNAVSCSAVLSRTICGICSSSSRVPIIGTQIRPPASLRMKLIASGVTICGRHHQVALVLAILVVEHDDHLAGADVGDRILDRVERRCALGQLQSPVPAAPAVSRCSVRYDGSRRPERSSEIADSVSPAVRGELGSGEPRGVHRGVEGGGKLAHSPTRLGPDLTNVKPPLSRYFIVASEPSDHRRTTIKIEIGS